MDLQFVSSGEDAVEYAVKTVCYATTPQFECVAFATSFFGLHCGRVCG